MELKTNKKVLFLTRNGQKLEKFLQCMSQDNVIVLQSYQPFALQPFDECMRDILVAVYQENIGEIVVAATVADEKSEGDILNKIIENKGLSAVKTLEYLFKNAMPEFPAVNIKEWLEPSQPLKERVKNTVKVIQGHPLLPSHVKVKELWLDEMQSQLKFSENEAI
jgi:carbonic anhydrase